MAINLGGNNGVRNNSGNVLDLKKNDILDLTKSNPGLTNITLGAGWDVAVTGESFDLDLSAFLLNQNGKITGGEDVIYFKNRSASGISLSEDNRTGAGDGDDENIVIDLNKINSSVHKIVFIVNIYDATTRRQTFGMINNSYVRLLNMSNNKELCRFNLKEDGSTATAMIFCELYREGSEWKFKAIGEGKVVSDLNGIAALYM